MPPPLLPFPLKILAAIVALFVLAGCQPGPNPRPVPSVSQIGSELKCLSGDHGYSDAQAGWGFCYPPSWQYRIRAQSSQSPDPRELDITFDITDIPCTVASAAPGQPAADLTATKLLPDMGSSLNRYLSPNSRDFIAIFHR